MSVISGFKDIKNLLNSKVQPCTAQYIGRNRQGIDTVPNLFYFAHDPAVFPWVADSGTNKSVTTFGLGLGTHARAGDIIRFLTGSLVGEIIFVQSVNTTTHTVTFSQEMAAAAAAGDTFELLRPAHGDVVTPASNAGFGNLLKTGVYDTVAGGWIPFPVASGAFPTVSNFEATDTQYPNAPTTLARIGGLVDDTSPTTVAENTMGTPRITPKRAFHVNLRNDSGTEISPATETTLSALNTKLTPATTGTEATVAASASTVTILAANASHKGRSVRNDSTAILYLRLGTGSATSASSIKLFPDETFFIEPGEYSGIIAGIWASATGNARVWEGT